ncbi:MAG: ribonuclease P protein component [Proteobacteria bacterium]|nr:ribonuclease P protein component [Pseudomonadota bacterium]
MAVDVRRMLKRADFLKVKAQGKRAMAQAFVLQYLDVAEEAGVSVGFTTSTAALGNAVHRNRARRRLRAAFDDVCRLNPAAQGAGKWLVVVGKKPVFEIDYAYLVKDMRKALTEAGIAC